MLEITNETVTQAIPVEQKDSKCKPNLARRIYNSAVVTAAGASLVFEQSPANEIIRVEAGLDVLQNTGSALAVGATVAAITVGIEGVSSGLIIAGLHAEGGLVQRFKSRIQSSKDMSKEQIESSAKKSAFLGKVANFGADVAIALGLGAGLVTAKHHIADPDPTIKKDIKTSAKATAIVSGVSGAIGYLAGGGIANAEKVGLETPAQYVIDYGTDTKFWMGTLALGYGVSYSVKGIKRLRHKSQKNQAD